MLRGLPGKLTISGVLEAAPGPAPEARVVVDDQYCAGHAQNDAGPATDRPAGYPANALSADQRAGPRASSPVISAVAMVPMTPSCVVQETGGLVAGLGEDGFAGEQRHEPAP